MGGEAEDRGPPMSLPLPVRFVYASVDDREVVLRLGWSDRATEADPSTTYSATYVMSPRTALEMRGLLDELLTV